jgi:hypothetical protein
VLLGLCGVWVTLVEMGMLVIVVLVLGSRVLSALGCWGVGLLD